MRLLHARHDHERRLAAEQKCASGRFRDRARHAGQCLPVRHVSAYCRGRADCGAAEAGMSQELSRRDFLSALGGGIVVLCAAEAIDAQESGRRGQNDAPPKEISAWLHIAEDGLVTAYTGKTEVGQNIRTSLMQAAAEEL